MHNTYNTLSSRHNTLTVVSGVLSVVSGVLSITIPIVGWVSRVVTASSNTNRTFGSWTCSLLRVWSCSLCDWKMSWTLWQAGGGGDTNSWQAGGASGGGASGGGRDGGIRKVFTHSHIQIQLDYLYS